MRKNFSLITMLMTLLLLTSLATNVAAEQEGVEEGPLEDFGVIAEEIFEEENENDPPEFFPLDHVKDVLLTYTISCCLEGRSFGTGSVLHVTNVARIDNSGNGNLTLYVLPSNTSNVNNAVGRYTITLGSSNRTHNIQFTGVELGKQYKIRAEYSGPGRAIGEVYRWSH